MKTLYFDCGMGAAGDMLSAALLELFDDKQAVLDELNALGIPGVEFKAEVSTKCGINGTLLTVLCREAQKEAVVQAIFKHTATIGIRETLCRRYVLTRTEETVETALGPVRRKVSSGYGVQRAKFEHDDLAALAGKNGLSLTEVMEKIGR